MHELHGAVLRPDSSNPNLYRCYGKIKTIKPRTFTEPSKVIVLLMGDCGVKTIQSNAFAALKNLEYLDLRRNNLTEIKREHFAGLSTINSLRLDNNQIKTIDSYAFEGIPLQYTVLYENPLEYADLGLFSNETILIDLDNTTSDFIFPQEPRPNLKHLLLRGSKYPDGNEPFRGLGPFRNVTVLKVEIDKFVGGVQIMSISDIFPHLYSLDINNCLVFNLGKDFKEDRCVIHLKN